MSDEAFRGLRDIIYDNSGIYYQDQKKVVLENRLIRRIQDGGFENYENYLSFLRNDPLRNKEISFLFDIVTTNETSFFRDWTQLEVFQSMVLPAVIKNAEESGHKRLMLWSAGCSTGEEPFTLAILILNKLPAIQFSGWNIDIHGSDISEGVLNSARRSEYSAYSIRNIPSEYLDRYFNKNDNGKYTVIPEVKKIVRLSRMNLMDGMKIRMLQDIDIVFCRNVLIYLNDAAKKRVISNIYDCLSPGGYLFIGHADSLFNISKAFKLVNMKKMLVYQK